MRNLMLSTLIYGIIAASLPAGAAFVPGKIGAENRYQITFAGDGTSRVQGLLTRQAVEGDHILTNLSAQMETVQVTPSLIAVRLLGIRHAMEVNGQKQDMGEAIARLEKPCYLSVDAKGRVLTVSFAADTPIPARRLMRTLVSGLEFAQSGSGVRAWKTTQDTVNGAAEVAYRYVSGGTVEKRITAYADARRIGPKGAPQMRPATEGALAFTFRQGRLLRVEGTCSTQFRFSGKTFSESRDRFQLTWQSGRMESMTELEGLQTTYRAQGAGNAPTALHAYDANPGAQQAAWLPLLKGATVESLRADLAADDAKETQNDSGLFERLCALMTLHPETCADFAQSLNAAQPGNFSTRMLLGALSSVAGAAQQRGATNTPAMQAAERALTQILESHKAQPEMVVQVASTLGLIGAPSLELERLLERLADSQDPDIAGSCALALGGVAQHGAPPVAKAALAYLQRSLPKADDLRKQTLLAALGNAGSADTLNTLATYARYPSETLRAIAMMSLRLVPGARATTLLSQGLHDADPDVRLGAARAFEFRPFTAAEIHTFTALAATEKTERVRLALLENLHLEAPYYPQVRSTLRRAAAHDASTDIRRTIATWL